ncbi:glycosyltransferase family 87 protein [Tautonia plasticadhaerens]|uniref:DUF2029 domain-containing protein n=1 Tax=Tautonia plasticadhaerens TaxID=2527974 RepID=A0A518H1H4_9BACT|nr:glycosyltransferase family 87 protein [Tautonia plasticadhaerens]QDV34689.1 hypothetical protein ElP_25830 [Tautonia plasticadhaerens]
MAPYHRRVDILIPLYLALAAAWASATLWLAPDLSLIDAGLMAWALSLALALTLRRWDRRTAARRPPGDRSPGRFSSNSLLLVATAFLAVTVLAGAVHDYALYLRFWAVVRMGGDPWFVEHGYWGAYPPNAYGPLFNALAPLAAVNPLAPKLLFAAAYGAAAVALLKHLADGRRTSPLAVAGLMAWAWGPYAWVEVAIRGHFDVLVGLAAIAAVHARRKDRDLPCAVALAAGTLLKFFPIVLLPFLALDRGRLRVRLLATSAGLIALGLGLSWLVWGPSTFRPLGFAAGRSSSYLSIFRFLRGRYSPLRGPLPDPDLDRLAGPALALGLLGAWVWCRARHPEPESAAVLAALTTLLLSQNGLPQYQMVPLMLASYWVAQDWSRLRRRAALAAALLGYFGWISAFEVAYLLIGDGSTWLEDVVGLPTFALGCVLAAAVVRSEPAVRLTPR